MNLKTGVQVVVIDPWVNQVKLQKEHQIKLGKIDNENKVDSLIVAVGHDQFRSLSAKELKSFVMDQSQLLVM